MKHVRWFVPALCIVFAMSCRKPERLEEALLRAEQIRDSHVGAMVVARSLHDSLPEKAFAELHIADVMGNTIKNLGGHEVSYFSYQADPKHVLRMLTTLPFSRFATIADTTARIISPRDLDPIRTQLSDTERAVGADFWNATDHYIAYECIKPPMKHTLLIHPTTHHILHRIEQVM